MRCAHACVCYCRRNRDPSHHSIWFEVTCLLRCPLTSQSDIDAARQQVEDGLRFIRRLQDITAARPKVGVVMGDVFQELLRRISRGKSMGHATGTGIARDTGHYDAIGTDPSLQSLSDSLNHSLIRELTFQSPNHSTPPPMIHIAVLCRRAAW